MAQVIVISGATSGVGETLVQQFLSKGWQVVGLGRNLKKLEVFKEDFGKNFLGIAIDIRNPQEVNQAFSTIRKSYGRIDMLVNNAAVFKMAPFLESSFEDIDALVDTNLKAGMYITLEALKIMKDSRLPSRIVNITSVASLHGIPMQSIYCASKYGLRGFSEALNQEIIKDNISITTICPGGIDTPLWNETNRYPGGSTDQLLRPSDISSLIEYIATLDPSVILKEVTLFPSNEWH